MDESSKNATYILGLRLGTLEFGTVVYNKCYAYRCCLWILAQLRYIERQIDGSSSHNFAFDGIRYYGAMAMLSPRILKQFDDTNLRQGVKNFLVMLAHCRKRIDLQDNTSRIIKFGYDSKRVGG